jgi:hypothetical protein
MADLYLKRGWRERGIERLELIVHALGIDEDRVARDRLVGLAMRYRALDPALERIASAGP